MAFHHYPTWNDGDIVLRELERLLDSKDEDVRDSARHLYYLCFQYSDTGIPRGISLSGKLGQRPIFSIREGPVWAFISKMPDGKLILLHMVELSGGSYAINLEWATNRLREELGL